jgi:hypothetical protein
MSNVVLFEDQRRLLDGFDQQMEGHTLVAEAANLGRAFQVLQQMATGEVEVDFVLLDANLSPDGRDAVFRHEIPVNELDIKTGLFGRKKMPRPRIVEVRSYDDQYRKLGGHAMAILDVMQQTGMTAKTIGISGDSMDSYGLIVDANLTKWGIKKLAATMASLSES